MKVEHSVQKVSKGPGGQYVVGETRKPAAVAEFEVLYHEIRALANRLGHLTAGTSKHMECNLQSCFSKSRRLTFSMNVSRLLDYILSRQNSYTVYTALLSLHNVLNRQAAHPAVAKQILQCLDHGKKVYELHRHERYVTKEKKSQRNYFKEETSSISR